MTITAELGAFKARGPGHGLLRIGGLSAAAGQLTFSIMRNQGSEPYLGTQRAWQTTEVWHTPATVEQLGAEVVIAVGPEIVDPIANQPATVAYRITIAVGGVKGEGKTLHISRPLLGSGAAAVDLVAESDRLAGEEAARRAAEEDARRAVEQTRLLEEARRIEAQPPPPVTPSPEPGSPRRALLLAALVALVVAGAVAGAWYGCMIEGFGAPGCAGAAPEAPPPADATAPAGTTLSCAGLDAAACLALARQALADGQLEPARQLLQQAGQMGSADASNLIARMYDPQTWRADASPLAQPDWETAVYWYEIAARADDVSGKLGAGRLLCEHSSIDFDRKRGLDYLRQAAAAGNAEAKPLLTVCEEKVS